MGFSILESVQRESQLEISNDCVEFLETKACHMPYLASHFLHQYAAKTYFSGFVSF